MGYYIGIDFGKRRIGIAISDLNKKIAFPLTVIDRKNVNNIYDAINDVISDRQIEKFIVGLPIRTDGKDSKFANSVINFSNKLRETFNIDVVEWDERYTSAIARNVLDFSNVSRKKQRKVIDKISAQIILQSYLDYINLNVND